MKKFIFSILASLIFIGVGVFMIAMPKAFLGILVIIFSIFLIIGAIKSIVMLFKLKLLNTKLKLTITFKALLNIVIGVIAIVLAAKNPAAISTILVYLIAIDFFANSIVDMFDYAMLRNLAIPSGTLGFEIFTSLLFGILFLIFPQIISDIAVTILAVVVICVGVMVALFGIYSFYIDRQFKKFGINRKEGKSAEAEFSEVDNN